MQFEDEEMADYWHKRYLEALFQSESAMSSNARAAYEDLASHYYAMKRFCDRRSPVQEQQLAA
jgi:hypothetical protein